MKGFSAILLALALPTLATLVSCRSSSPLSAPATQPVSSMSSTTMPQSLAGMWFISKEKHEVGLGAGEPAMGHWHLRFIDSGGKWQHSDVEEGFAYTMLPDGTIKAIVNPANPIEARYCPDRNEILWDGLWYRAK